MVYKEPLYIYILMKFIVQQPDYYIYTSIIKIMSNLQQKSQKQRKQEEGKLIFKTVVSAHCLLGLNYDQHPL